MKGIKKTKNQLLRELTLLKRKNKILNDSLNNIEKYLELIKQNAQKDISFWKKVLDMVPMLIFINIPGKNWWANAHAEKVLGISPKELSSYDVKTFFSFFHPDDLPKVKTIATDEILKGKTVFLEIRLHDNKGNWKWFLTTTSPLEYPGESDVPKIIGTAINIDDRKKMEIALRESEEKYKALLENMPDLVFVTNQGKITFANQSAFKYTGYTREKLLSFYYHDIIAPEYTNMAAKNIKKRYHGQKIDEYEIEIVTKSGERKPFLVRGSLINIKEEKSIIYVLTDLSDTKSKLASQEYSKTVIKMQENDRKQISIILHEGVLQLLISAKLRLSAYESKPTGNVKDELKNITEIIDKALGQLRNTSVYLHPIILDDLGMKNAISSLCRDYKERTGINIKLRKYKFPDVVQNEILINLYRITQEALDNIEKHSFAKNVILSFSHKEHALNVKIIDDGKGFDSSSIARKYNDNTFGLKNMKERVNFFNGQMDINSHPGRGTEIVIKIPY
jgi:PAS domain S-box-containing protein